MKRLTAMILVLVMILTMVPMTASAATLNFTDIAGHWSESIVKDAASRGIVSGYQQYDGTYLYKPDNLMTRQEFFTLVVKVLSAQPDTTGVDISKFCDVVTTEWYADTVKKAVAAGITNGTTTKEKDGYDSFGIGLMITRQEAAKIVSSIIDPDKQMTYETMQTGEAKYNAIKDKADIADWAKSHVEKVFVRGYMQGASNPDGTTSFNPTSALTRAEAATLLLNVVKNESRILGPKQSGTSVPTPTPVPSTTDGAVTPDTGSNIKGTIFTKSCGADIKAVKSEKVDGSDKGCSCKGDVTFDEGRGSKGDPFVIRNAAQLNHVREHIGEGEFFILACDIKIDDDYCTTSARSEGSWAGGNFAPIGTAKEPFDGVFDGNGYTVKGLTIEGSGEGAGLFGYISDDGSVTGLTIANSTVTAKNMQYVAMIAGHTEGDIENCEVAEDCAVNGGSNVGGITGYTTASVENCKNAGEVKASGSNGGGIAGSISAGKAGIRNCINEGDVLANENAGGIAGYTYAVGNTLQIKECQSEGRITVTSGNAGGIVGKTNGGTVNTEVSYCLNEGVVSGNGYCGGIVGENTGNGTCIYNYNKGIIDGSNSGGIVGFNKGELKLCINGGEVRGKALAGGIAASQSDGDATLQQCYNSAAVSATTAAGGIIGDNARTLLSCYNLGAVTATNYAGGIAGRNSSRIRICYNLGKVTGDLAGQAVGSNRGTCEYVYWLTDNGGKANGELQGNTSQGVTSPLTKAQLQGSDTMGGMNGKKQAINVHFNEVAGSEVWGFAAADTYPALKNMFI